MKIVHVLWGLQTGGTEYMLADIANNQSKTEKVFVIVVDDNVNQDVLKKFSSKISFFFCGRKKGRKSLLAFMKLNYFLFKIRPDVTHLHMGWGLGKIVLWPGKKVRTVHNTSNSCEEYYKFKRIFAISNAVAAEITAQGYDSVVVSNGINVNAVNRIKLKSFDDNFVHIIQIGRILLKQKGQDLLVEAVSQIEKLDKLKPFKIHFVGAGKDIDYLQKLVERNQLQNIFVFEGEKDRNWVYENLCNYDLFVQPSYFEGFGLTVAEAMAAGVPILVSDIEGPLEIISSPSKKLGWTFKKGDAADLSMKLVKFLNGEYDSGLLSDAVEHVKECYDVSTTAQKYIEEYKKIL